MAGCVAAVAAHVVRRPVSVAVSGRASPPPGVDPGNRLAVRQGQSRAYSRAVRAGPAHSVVSCMLIRNTAANLAGQLLYPLLALVLVPFYLRQLGLEAYGLVGLMSLVVSLLAVFSRGLGSAVQREIGRRSGTAAATTLRQLLRSVEVLYWALAAALALLLAAAAFTIGPRWVQAQHLSPGTVTTCLVLLAVRVAVGFPHSVYQSVFVGAERQVLGNALNAVIALTSASCGVASVLVFHSVVAVYASEV